MTPRPHIQVPHYGNKGNKRPFPWQPAVALLLIWIGSLMAWNWIWGLLFLFWTIPSLCTGRIHLISEVDRKHHPVLFFAILVTWILLSLYLIAVDIGSFLD